MPFRKLFILKIFPASHSTILPLTSILVFYCCVTNYHRLATQNYWWSHSFHWSSACGLARLQADVSGAVFHVRLSWGGTHFQALSGFWQNSSPCKCRTEVLFSFWEEIPARWPYMPSYCVAVPSRPAGSDSDGVSRNIMHHRSDIPIPLHICWFPSTLKCFMPLFVILNILIKVNWSWARFTQQSRGLLPRKLSAKFVPKHFPLLNLLKFFFWKNLYSNYRGGEYKANCNKTRTCW